MKRIRIIALAAAVIFTVAIYMLLDKQTPQQGADTTKYQEVVVAAADIPKGAAIEASMLTKANVPEAYILEDTLIDPEEALDQVSLAFIPKGEAIIRKRLSLKGSRETGLSYKIPENMRAITFGVDVEKGVANMIVPGNRVDILTTQLLTKGENGEPDFYETKYLLSNVEILAIDSVMTEADQQKFIQAGASYTSATLALSPEDAALLESTIFSIRQGGGNFRFVLRPAEKKEVKGES